MIRQQARLSLSVHAVVRCPGLAPIVRPNCLKFAVVTSSSSPQILAVPAGSVTEETVTKQQATVPRPAGTRARPVPGDQQAGDRAESLDGLSGGRGGGCPPVRAIRRVAGRLRRRHLAGWRGGSRTGQPRSHANKQRAIALAAVSGRGWPGRYSPVPSVIVLHVQQESVRSAWCR